MKRSFLLVLLAIPPVAAVVVGIWFTGGDSVAGDPVASPGATPQQVNQLTPEQERLVDAKSEAAKAAGVPYDPGGLAQISRPQPVRTSVEKVRLTREDLQRALQESLPAMQEQLNEVAKEQGPEAAKAIEEQIRKEIQTAIDGLPPEGIDLEVPAIEIGQGSIQFSKYTYTTGGSASDPVSLIFGGPQGSDWDVNYDLRNWTSIWWRDENAGGWDPLCGSKQQIYVWDAVHGGSDSWRLNSYGLQPNWDGCFLDERFHVRIFPGGYDNHSGGFKEYSFGAAHFEDKTHDVKSWEGAETLVQLSFRDLNTGGLLWFVGNIYYQQLYSAETWRCCVNDGYIAFIILNY